MTEKTKEEMSYEMKDELPYSLNEYIASLCDFGQKGYTKEKSPYLLPSESLDDYIVSLCDLENDPTLGDNC